MAPVTGCLNAAWKVKLLVANSPTWIALTAPALAMDQTRIYQLRETDYPFPRCIINDSSEGGSIEFTKISLSNWSRVANLLVTFEIEIPESVMATSPTYEDEGNWFISQTGAIIGEVMELGTPPLVEVGGEYPVNLTQVASVEGPSRLSWEERDEYDLLPVDGKVQLPLWIQTFQVTPAP